MKTMFYIAKNHSDSYYLCGDGNFRIGFLSGHGKSDTLTYKTFRRAWNRYKKIKKTHPDAVVSEIPTI